MTIGVPHGQPNLGRLETLDVRSVWPHEAHSFTPWLQANSDVLSEVLGMDLVLSHAEHPVGGFSLDLIGMDEATGETVIIENQLETTDHPHLGQLLTYAGGTDPVNIVWVATRFREEHRAALDWLNARTDEETRFFGLEVSAVRIGNSVPAPHLNLVVQPNDWGKQVRSSTHEGSVSARGMAYRDFWTLFLDRVRVERPGWTNAQKGSKENWQGLPSGVSTIALNCTFSRGQLCSEVYFQDPDPAVNDARFTRAVALREELEAAFGGTLPFEALAGRKGCRIKAYRDGDVERTDEWDSYVDWFIASQTSLRKAFDAIGGFNALDAHNAEGRL